MRRAAKRSPRSLRDMRNEGSVGDGGHAAKPAMSIDEDKRFDPFVDRPQPEANNLPNPKGSALYQFRRAL